MGNISPKQFGMMGSPTPVKTVGPVQKMPTMGIGTMGTMGTPKPVQKMPTMGIGTMGTPKPKIVGR